MTKMTDDNVDKYIFQNKPIFILFYSPNLPMHNNLLRIFEKFEERLIDKIDVLICDIENTIKVKQYFQMSILPAVLLMKNNKDYGNLAGPASETKYEQILIDGLTKILEE